MWQPRLSISIRLIAGVRHHPWITAAALLGAAVASSSPFLLPETYSTKAGEWHTVLLSDGTLARLGPRTEIEVRYDDERRLIEQPSGQASYEVAHEAHRPLSVQCGAAMARAIGTKFSVTCNGKDMSVAVAEGTVSAFRDFAHPDQVPSVDHVFVVAGESVLVEQWTPLRPKPINVEANFAWERGRIKFEGTPIEQAIAEFNRRHKHQIPIPRVYDPNFVVVGEYDLQNPEQFFQFLKTSPALQPPPKSK